MSVVVGSTALVGIGTESSEGLDCEEAHVDDCVDVVGCEADPDMFVVGLGVEGEDDGGEEGMAEFGAG